jgi:SAM-dependent methyltransferase
MGPDLKIKEYYETLYDGEYMASYNDDVWEYCRAKVIQNMLKRILHSSSIRSVCDFGCGRGRTLELLIPLLSKEVEVWGIDISEKAIQDCKQRIHGNFLCEDISTISLSRTFDLVINSEVLEHVPEVEPVIANISHHMAPGGVLLMTTPCANPLSADWIEDRLAGGPLSTRDGYVLFKMSDPEEHVRRLTSTDVHQLFQKYDVKMNIYYSSHWVEHFAQKALMRGIPWMNSHIPAFWRVFRQMNWVKFFGGIGRVDWFLFRRLPFGSGMIGIGRKSIS